MALRISIGADPELFLRKKSTGEYVSAHGLLPGTKMKPHPVTFGAVQVDGTAAEFNILPAFSSGEFTGNISSVLKDLQTIVGDGYELVATPTVEYPEDYFQSLPPVVRELGCDPDFNAWTGKVNERPNRLRSTLCSGGGHVHIGWTKNEDVNDPDFFDECAIVIRQVDYYLGMNSLKWDSDKKRRGLYGMAGAFRVKPYGVEYRSLSNVWVRSPQLQAWVQNTAYKAVSDLVSGDCKMEDHLGDLAQRFINDSESWWKPSDILKSEEHKKVETMMRHTGLGNPPKVPSGDAISTAETKRRILSNTSVGLGMYKVGFDDGSFETMTVEQINAFKNQEF